MPSASVTGAAYQGVPASSGSPAAMLPVHVSRAVGPPSGSGWLSGIVPWIVKPHAQAARREPQLPTIARQWTRLSGDAPAADVEGVAARRAARRGP